MPFRPYINRRVTQLEREFQTELDRASSAGADHGVDRRDIGRGAAAAVRAHGRIRSRAGAEPARSAPGICKIRMIGDVKHLRPELHSEPFPELPGLGNGQIQVVEAGIAKNVAAGVSEGTDRRRQQKGLPI